MIERILAVMIKEVLQMARDRLTIGMMFGIPIVQLLLFGYAINGDPRHLPLAIEMNDHSALTRSVDAALRNTTYFDVTQVVDRHDEADRLVRDGTVQFVVTIPQDFTRDLVRGERPQLLVTADATDPSATGNALAAISQAVQTGLAHDLIGPLGSLQPGQAPVDVVLHRSYNPEGITSYNIVPGLLGVVLSITMVMMTAMAVTRETEQGTMENLLAMPLRPVEVMVGKIAPYLFIGFIQTLVILGFATFLFHVPFAGSPVLAILVTLLFATVSLALGFTLSTIAQTQLQAMQMSFFYMLPSILLSGFLFPFRGMPGWAQAIGEAIPVTHFLRLIRGILLKGWGVADSLPHMAVLALMLLVLGSVAILRYRDTIG
ncbi:ABC transporter permease [Sphingomonas sp.]|uniref:ABC transporter permease n=1 Tax=Sphingomonas sp. TaxID=28214 RepID=UPI001B185A82|nr:ABC transporter permease [Sphingomonas sp.]MBO9713274.1 ABC transporter permease [Sphingomonas sp.]